MKIFRNILTIVLAIILLFVIVSFLLPRKYIVERVISIKADKSLAVKLVSHFDQGDAWTPYDKTADEGPDRYFIP